MNKKFTKLIAALALLVFMMPSLAGWGQTSDYTIAFQAHSSSDQSTSLTDNNAINYLSEGDSYVTTITGVSKVYQAAPGKGWKLGTGSAAGSFTMNLSNDGKVTAAKLYIKAAKYSTDGGNIQIRLNGNSTTNYNYYINSSDLTADITEYEWQLTSAIDIESIKISTTQKRAYVHSIRVTYYTGAVTYDVTYKANEGSGDDLVDNNGGDGYASGASVTVKANEGTGNPNFTRTGYDFNKWNTRADGAGTNYTSGSSFNISSNTNLYAQWTKKNYNVAVSSIEDVTLTATYGANTIAEGNNANVPYGTAVTLAATGLGTGQAFVWSITKTTDGTDVTADVLSGTTLTVPDYAVTIGGTVATTYTVTYDCNGGTSGCPENVTGIASGSSITLAAAPTKTNYVFTGWNDGTTTYQAGASYTVTGNVTLTAQWVAGGTGTITFGSASGSVQINGASIQANDNLGNEWDITTVGGGFSQNSAYSQVGTGNNRASSITFSMELPTSYQITSLSAKFGAFSGDTGSITLMVGETTVGSGSLDGTNDVVTTSNVVVIGNELTVSVTNTNNLRVKCYYITYTFTAIGDDPIISAPNTINLISTDTDNEFAYEIVNPVSGKTLSATTTTSWISNIIVTSEKVTFTTSENTSTTDDRQGSITLCYDGAEDKVVTINQGKVDYAAMPFSYTGNGNSGSLVTGLTSNLTSSYTNGWPAMKFDAAGKYLTLKLHEAPASISYDIRPSASSWTGTFKVQTSADGESFTDLVSYTSLSNDTETKTHVDLPSTARYIRWYFESKSSGFNVALGNIKANMQYDIYGTATTATFAPTDAKKCTIYNGGVLTVTGTLTNTTAANLIIEDGGQLIANSAVAATMQKSITGYGNTTGNWYFISSPLADNVAPTSVENLINADGYDLFYFDQRRTNEWVNIKNQANYNLTPGQGYLYANQADKTLEFAGTLYNGDGIVPIACTDGAEFRGWNLVGNPFPCNANVGRPFFICNGTSVEASTGSIPPCTGVMVQAGEINGETISYDNVATSVTFTKANPVEAPQSNQVQMTLAQNVTHRDGASTTAIDNAIVSFNEGNYLEKFIFNANASKLYIPEGGKDFAIVSAKAQGELPVSFKANEDGEYTLTVSPEGVEINYLHLIDNMTGTDVDLLANPSYTFQAGANDYESRFKLVFASSICEDANGDNETFAFYCNGSWVINNSGEATLQVIDINGRMVSNETINGGVAKAIHAAPGVYMLRLVNGENVMVQKVVVR